MTEYLVGRVLAFLEAQCGAGRFGNHFGSAQGAVRVFHKVDSSVYCTASSMAGFFHVDDRSATAPLPPIIYVGSTTSISPAMTLPLFARQIARKGTNIGDGKECLQFAITRQAVASCRVW